MKPNELIGTTVAINSLTEEQQAKLAEGNFSFEDTQTVEQFKYNEGVKDIFVKKNTKTGKLFFQYGAKTGIVSMKKALEHPMISHVIGQAKDKKGNNIPGMAQHMFLMHNEAEGGAEVICKF